MKAPINHLYSTIINWLDEHTSKSIIGFSRSLLAAGMLLQLAFNNIDSIIPVHKLQALDLNALRYRCNFFLLFNASHPVEMQILAILILAFTLTGYLIKLTSLLHFWIVASFFMFKPGITSVENIEMVITLLLVPVCLFDNRKNHWHKPFINNTFNDLIQSIFLFFIKLQVAFIYYDSLHDKLYIKEWLNGTVIYYWFTHNFFGLHPSLISFLEPFLTSIPVLLLLAWSSLAFEALLAIALIFPLRFRLLLLKYGIIFHFSILLIHGYSSLFFAMSAALFLYLYPAKKPFSLLIQ